MEIYIIVRNIKGKHHFKQFSI